MQSKLVFVESKRNPYPAWIGKAIFSKSGKTVYFDGKAFKNGRQELVSGDIYWISGVKKDGNDRLWANTRKIKIDRSVVEEYLNFIGATKLPKSKFEIVDLDNNPPKQTTYELENEKLDDKSKHLFQNDWYSQRNQSNESSK